ncbi:MAG: ParB/RepB/Spo0J family partition protein [Bacilli bacterium]|nr:ParB/RepB/Spo0J family partition protein [Bacilli bacterium]
MGLISMNMEDKILQIPIEDIIPNRFQPRLTFDDQALQELAASIKEHGIIQPLVLRKLGDKYEIIAGERRYKASQMAGLTTVPAVISNIDDDKSAEVALIENIQRKNLTSIEEAKSYKNLLDRGYSTQEQLAEKLGVSQSTIANKLRLLNLADEVQDALLNEKISERHARALLALKDQEEQVKWLNKILDERLTVRQLDIELKKVLNNTEDEEDEAIPIVELTPNIEEIKSNALDINPTQGLHDIESMLKPSMPGEKTFDLSTPIDNVETLDFDDTSVEETVQPEKPQNKFFNFLEDEVADMNTEESIDDIFNKQPVSNDINDNNINNVSETIEINNPVENVEQPKLDVPTIDEINIVQTLDENIIPVVEENIIENNINEELVNASVENLINNNDSLNNNFFTFGNKEEEISNEIPVIEPTIPEINIVNDDVIENNIEDNNVIERVTEVKVDNVFDPMSMVNTLEPDYQEKVEEAQGIDLKTAINTIRDTKESLIEKGFNIMIDEADLGDSYTITINIIK